MKPMDKITQFSIAEHYVEGGRGREGAVFCKFYLRWVLSLGSLGSVNNFVVANEFFKTLEFS
jgi:hypothetical protein